MKKAFTLAEVLITLSIIGIVAAMTLPALIQKNQDKELIARTKKVYSDINNALLQWSNDNGVVGDNSFLFNATDSSQVVAANLIKYFSGAKLCTGKNQKGCSKYYYEVKYATKRYDNNDTLTVATWDDPRIIFSNGAVLVVRSNRTACTPQEYSKTEYDENGTVIKNPDGSDKTTTYISENCANLIFDVNGPKRPNQYGHDTFHLWVFKTKIKPATEAYAGGNSFLNIITGSENLEYEYYNK